jgi:hypothetical protein
MPTVVAPARPPITVTPKTTTPVTPKTSTATPKTSITTPKTSITTPKAPIVVTPPAVTSSHTSTSNNFNETMVGGEIVGLVLFGALLLCVIAMVFFNLKRK